MTTVLMRKIRRIGGNSMHPTEVIELIIVGVSLVIIIILSFILKGKWRKVGWSFSVAILIIYAVFYIVRPYWIDYKIEKKIDLLVPHLEQQFPNEKWKISTVPHREDGYEHLNPYYIGVIFENEPEVTYHYWVEAKNNIYQISYSTTKHGDEFKHEK